ncbi:hypothetical protein CC80DRAFT_491036 [Byssothecium circinans]|uniref:Uncharacterized protein n=1 Tax=Byssothecium circinans TaxID=147558 RepID=A0A6A5UBL4_9PLEO|nr:hypothetical protein CC80DRAFT_491036 [Byssothecium circinans]
MASRLTSAVSVPTFTRREEQNHYKNHANASALAFGPKAPSALVDYEKQVTCPPRITNRQPRSPLCNAP